MDNLWSFVLKSKTCVDICENPCYLWETKKQRIKADYTDF